MKLIDFKIKHSEIIEYFQIVEEELKIIYSIIKNGFTNTSDIEDYKLNQIIKELIKLNIDESIINKNNMMFIQTELKKKRDYYFYKCYKVIPKIRNVEKSTKFEDACYILEEDLKTIKALSKDLKKSVNKAKSIYINK